MTRALGFLTRNWPLKLAAIALAVVLYAGLVLSQNARVWPGRVPIQVLNQPSSAFILGQLDDVTNIRYFAPQQAADRLSSAAFTASINLANVQIDPNNPFVTVDVKLEPIDDSIRVIDYRPTQIRIRLDPIITRDVQVQVSQGVVPQGLAAGAAELSQRTVSVTGPQSVVSQVVAAEARVRIQPSGIDLDQLVDLIVVDGRGEQLNPVEISPSAVRVRIEVSSEITTKTVPVVPVVTGVPGAGFDLASAAVEPAVVTLSGNAVTLAGIGSVSTTEVSIEGATADFSAAADVVLPEAVTVVDSTSVTIIVRLRAREATRSLSVGVRLVGADPDRTYALGAERVLVTVGGSEQGLNALNATGLTAIADVAGLEEGQQNVRVRVELPDGIELVSIGPETVIVFVSPRATPPPTPTPTPTPSPSPTPLPSPSPAESPSPEPASPSPDPSASVLESPSPEPSPSA